jgi:hypothetical protein
LDRHDIAAAEDWEARLGALILGADTIVFILSPAAVRSERCAWEVERAAELGKASLSQDRSANWQRHCGRTSNGSGNIHA